MVDLTDTTVLVSILIAALFAAVAALLMMGAHRARGWTALHRPTDGRQTNVHLEILWTGISSLVLFGIFLYVR